MRATAVIGMAPDIDPDSYDHSELGRYGIGNGTYVCVATELSDDYASLHRYLHLLVCLHILLLCQYILAD